MQQIVHIAWGNTAFNGGLVLPRHKIDKLGLMEYSSTPAILTAGQQVDLPDFTCSIERFGMEYRTQIVAKEGVHPLRGTMLLDGHI